MMKNKGFYILFAVLVLVLTAGLGLSWKSVSGNAGRLLFGREWK